MKKAFPAICVASLFAATLAACTEDDGQGHLSLAVTDAPVDSAARVVVEFTGVSVKPADGEEVVFEFDKPRQINLLDLQAGDNALLLDSVLLDAGEYEWIRLTVNAGMHASDSSIEFEDGSVYPLFIPSGNQTGLKLVRGFVVPAGGSADFTIDFDLRKSIVDPASPNTPYILKPALRLVDNAEVGMISGTVDAMIANATDCSPAVYVYEGMDVAADDVGSSNEPVASALVDMSGTTGEFKYTVAFLTTGEYTVALTCDAAADAADTDDGIAFEAQQNATVEINQTTSVDF